MSLRKFSLNYELGLKAANIYRQKSHYKCHPLSEYMIKVIMLNKTHVQGKAESDMQ